ncbi:hypothetical protein BX616_005092 [Lobosporangium transversale]|nr:hypothetical protein BX616_005092 [Lobosporangium transversale]
MPIYLFMMMIVLLYGSIQANGNYQFNRTVEMAKDGSNVVVWSEKAIRITSSQERNDLWAQAKNVSMTYKTYVGIAYEDFDNSTGNNKGKSIFVMYSGNGNVAFEYQKAHLKPRIDNDFLPGPSNQPAAERKASSFSLGVIGGATEFDLNFQTFSKGIKQKNINLLISLSRSTTSFVRQEAAVQAFRAMEQGITIFSCGALRSIASNYYNPMIVGSETSSRNSNTVNIEVHDKVWTMYQVVGDLWAYICCALTVITLALLVLPERIVNRLFAWITKRKKGRNSDDYVEADGYSDRAQEVPLNILDEPLECK